MGEPLADFSAQGVSCRSCICQSTYGKSGREGSCDSCKDCYEAEIACGQDGHVVEEIGTTLAEGMHVYDHGDPDLDEETDENDDALLSLESDSTDDLVDADTDVVISPAFPCGDAFESSIDKSDYGNPSSNGTAPLVSAMKGTRAKQGIVAKLSVSWAPDVYDPPVTSDSHTVKGHPRSSRKSHYKSKPPKSSSSTRSASSSKRDKKHSRRSSSSSRKDKSHSYRSSSSSISRTELRVPQNLQAQAYSASSDGSTRTEPIVPQNREAYSASSDGSSRTDSHSIESAKAYPLVPPENAAIPEAVPVLKTIEQSKCATSCKEKPLNLLSRQFSPARYKGMFSFWSQNQLAS